MTFDPSRDECLARCQQLLNALRDEPLVPPAEFDLLTIMLHLIGEDESPTRPDRKTPAPFKAQIVIDELAKGKT